MAAIKESLVGSLVVHVSVLVCPFMVAVVQVSGDVRLYFVQ